MGAEKVLIMTCYPGEGVVYSYVLLLLLLETYVAQLSLRCDPDTNDLTCRRAIWVHLCVNVQ